MARNNDHLNLRVGAYYGSGALGIALMAFTAWPWTAVLLWPAFSLACVAAGYFGLGSAIYRKREGRVPLPNRLLLAPAFLGQRWSWQHYRRSCRPWDAVAPNLLIGRILTNFEARQLAAEGVTAVLDLTAEFSEPPALRALTYCNIPLLDLTAPTPRELKQATQFIGQQIAAGATVYVHCKVGYSRTAAVVGAYLLASHGTSSLEETVTRLRSARPGLVIRPEARLALEAFASGEGRGDSERTVEPIT